MSQAPAGQSANGPVAVLHRVGGSVRAVIGTLAPPGHAGALADRRPALTDFKELPASRPAEIAAWLDDHGAGPVVVVLPASAVVCRTCTLPEADPEHLAQALALQAEAHQPTAVPPYRRATAVLPGAAGETSRSGIIVDWPQRAGDGEPAGGEDAQPQPWGNRRVTYAPDVGCVGALLNGHRPDEPLLWFDRSDGSLALAISHANGVILRATRVSAADPGAWADNVGRVVAETALSVGHTPAFTETLVNTASERIAGVDRNAALVVGQQTIENLRHRIDGTPPDPRWWRDYGVAVGALVAASGQLAPLTRLRLRPPAERPSRARRALGALSQPATAARLAVACALIFLAAPLAFSGLRLGLLKLKLPDLARYREEAEEAEAQLAMYRELQSEAWPMTKLLADLACCTPHGIDLEQIRVGDDRVRVSGRAKPNSKSNLTAQQVVALMQQNLRDSKIFENFTPTWGDPNTFGAYEFTLSANVVNAYRRHDYPLDLDYGAWTLAERLYGDGPPDPDADGADAVFIPAGATDPRPGDLERDTRPADLDRIASRPDAGRAAPPSDPLEDAASANPDKDAASSNPDKDAATANGRTARDTSRQRFHESRSPGRDSPSSRGTDRTPGGALPASKDVPPPMTQEQIDALSLPEAQEAYARISRALQQARVDDETKERLWRDWRAVRDRVRALKSDKE